MRELLAHGVFTWDGGERRSNRYGSFNICAEPYAGSAVASPTYDKALADSLRGKRVRVTAKVIATRKSGHIGDIFLGVYPSTPKVGEEVDLGVGIFDSQPCEWDKTVTSTFLQPGDGREELWIDPRKLYRLHDQTVNIYAEKTRAKFTPSPVLETKEETGLIANGDGSFQAKNVELSGRTRIAPKVERLGDGLFIMGGPHQKGERVEFNNDGPPTSWDRIRED